MAEGWWIYMVRCADASLYTGIARDPDARVAAHNRGAGAAYTRSRRPVELVWLERAADRGSALRREAAVKRLSAADKRRLLAAAPDAMPQRPARNIR